MTRASACRDIVCLQNTGNELLRVSFIYSVCAGMQSLIAIPYLTILTWERPEIVYVYGGDAGEGHRYCEATTTPLDSSSSMYYDVTILFVSSPSQSCRSPIIF
jgi:hypothetical protein